MTDVRGRGEAALVESDIEFTGRDATLLRTIDETGSVASASAELGRSRARALSRIETLESAFGMLVERRRGGSGGGGSRLTDGARELLNRYDRLAAALEAAAAIPETVLSGTVNSIDGEIATVETAIGTVRGIGHELSIGDRVQIRIGADAVTVNDPERDAEPDATSARNRRPGSVVSIGGGETVLEAAIDVDGTTFTALVTRESADRLGLAADRMVVLTWKATATRLVDRQ
ncbi:TOBE domain-containing protein [Halalkalirubrum salinum]|uniref:TOBE domain-containing protein n=1 Tax=Halalkalirubrum salinum TaxID=2563889 RepID=UPI0010FAFC49|nr:TOBE domain-containing protein [Halalkalirubrum salinum]